MIFLKFIIVCCFMLSLAACGEKEQENISNEETDTKAESPVVVETSSEVPELWDFHDVIYQIWHEAWPEKNTEMLTDLIPEIEAGFTKLKEAPLPGILRDKHEAWINGIEDMEKIIKTYKENAAAGQKEALLKTAEDLHTQFEMLVRLIRPVMKEIDQFHQELYMLYHYYMPEFNVQKIKDSTAELLLRMEPIEKAKLPARLTDKQSVFDQAKTDLKKSLNQLQQTVADEADKDQVNKAIETVHDKYQTLVEIFE